MEQYIISYLKNIYGGQLFHKNNKLILKVNNETYFIYPSKADKNYYIFELKQYPLILRDHNFLRGLFKVWSHSINVKNKIIPSEEDWKKFINDAFKYGVI